MDSLLPPALSEEEEAGPGCMLPMSNAEISIEWPGICLWARSSSKRLFIRWCTCSRFTSLSYKRRREGGWSGGGSTERERERRMAERERGIAGGGVKGEKEGHRG